MTPMLEIDGVGRYRYCPWWVLDDAAIELFEQGGDVQLVTFLHLQVNFMVKRKDFFEVV